LADANFDANARAASVLLFNNSADGISFCGRANGNRADAVVAGKPCPNLLYGSIFAIYEMVTGFILGA
jgi:hypothetical protein